MNRPLSSLMAFLEENWSVICIISILLVSAAVRLYYIDGFWISEGAGKELFGALRILEKGQFYFTKCIGTGVTGHFYHYLLAFPLLFSRSAYSVILFSNFLSILGIFLCYKIGSKYFDERVGIFSSLLFGLVSYSVLFFNGSPDSIYNIPVFSLGIGYFFMSLTVEKKSKSVVPLAILLALSTQIHPLLTFLIPLVLTGIAVIRPKIQLKHIALAFVALLVISPTFNRTIINAEYSSVMKSFSGEKKDTLNPSNNFQSHVRGSMDKFLSFFTRPLRDKGDEKWTFLVNPLLNFSAYFYILFLLIGIMITFYEVIVKRKSNFISLLFLLSFFLLVPLTTFLGSNIGGNTTRPGIRRFTPLYPFIFITIGISLSRIKDWINKFTESYNLKINIYIPIIFSFILVLLVPHLLFVNSSYEKEPITGGNKLEVVDTLITEFNISDYKLLERKVNFLGFSPGYLGDNSDGFNALFYIESTGRGSNGTNETGNVLVVREEDKFEEVVEQLHVTRSVEHGQVKLLGFEASESLNDENIQLTENEIKCKKTSYHLEPSFKEDNKSISIDIDSKDGNFPKFLHVKYETESKRAGIEGPKNHINLDVMDSDIHQINRTGERSLRITLDISEDVGSSCPEMIYGIRPGFNILTLRLTGDTECPETYLLFDK